MPSNENEDVNEINNALPLPVKKVEDNITTQNKDFETISEQLKEVNDAYKKQESALNTLVGTSDENFTKILQKLTTLADSVSVELSQKNNDLQKLSQYEGGYKVQFAKVKELEKQNGDLIANLASTKKALDDSESARNDEKISCEQRISEIKLQLEEKKDLLQKNQTLIDAKDKEIKDLKEDSLKKEKLEKKYAEAESEIKELEDKIDSLDKDKSKLQSQIDALDKENKDVNENLNRVSAVVNKYEKLKMNKLERAYELFSSFKERTRNNLKAVFETDSFLGFISNSMQWERIAGIWEQTKRKIVNDDNEDLAELRELFLILFETYNAGYLDAPYVLINPEINSKYNSNEQLIKNQKSDGNVKEVLLEGYIFKKNNAIHKAMIVVE